LKLYLFFIEYASNLSFVAVFIYPLLQWCRS